MKIEIRAISPTVHFRTAINAICDEYTMCVRTMCFVVLRSEMTAWKIASGRLSPALLILLPRVYTLFPQKLIFIFRCCVFGAARYKKRTYDEVHYPPGSVSLVKTFRDATPYVMEKQPGRLGRRESCNEMSPSSSQTLKRGTRGSKGVSTFFFV